MALMILYQFFAKRNHKNNFYKIDVLDKQSTFQKYVHNFKVYLSLQNTFQCNTNAFIIVNFNMKKSDNHCIIGINLY